MGAQWKELDDDDKEPFVSAYNADKLVYAGVKAKYDKKKQKEDAAAAATAAAEAVEEESDDNEE